jgi:hypothetical protein
MKRTRRIIVDGLAGGFIGALAVAGWFLILDVDRGQPFATPALLGQVLLRGSNAASAQAMTPLVVEYSIVHFAAFAAFGLAVSYLIEAAESQPPLMGGVLVLFGFFELFFIGAVGVVSEALLDTLVWWRIIMANLLATSAMAAYFMLRNRGFASQVSVWMGAGRLPSTASSEASTKAGARQR